MQDGPSAPAWIRIRNGIDSGEPDTLKGVRPVRGGRWKRSASHLASGLPRATMHAPRHAARALLPLALVGLLLAPLLGQATPRASAVTASHALLLVDADGTTYPAITLLSAPFR